MGDARRLHDRLRQGGHRRDIPGRKGSTCIVYIWHRDTALRHFFIFFSRSEGYGCRNINGYTGRRVLPMRRVRITVVRKACYRDLMERYENPIEHACDMEEG